jgi:hypothetical protein
VDKANVLAASRLWRRVVTEVGTEYADVALDPRYVDAASFGILRAPHAFDVIVTDNLFGDILSDEAAALAGSIGVLPSPPRSAPGSTSRSSAPRRLRRTAWGGRARGRGAGRISRPRPASRSRSLPACPEPGGFSGFFGPENQPIDFSVEDDVGRRSPPSARRPLAGSLSGSGGRR